MISDISGVTLFTERQFESSKKSCTEVSISEKWKTWKVWKA